MNVQELIYRILNSGRSPTNALAAVAEPAPAPANALASAGGFGVSDPSSLPANLRGGPMLDSAPTGALPRPSASPAPQIAQSAPVAAGGPNMGIGNALQGIFMPQRAQRNETVNWLTSQGLDEGTATLLAGNKTALQQFLLDRAQGGDPKKALELQKLGLEIEQMRSPTTDDVREYQFATQQGYEGTFADWVQSGNRPPSAVQEYEYAVQQGFPGTFEQWEASKRGGMSLQVDPESGAITFQQGANIKPLTEAQSKDTVFATRAKGALPIIDQFGDALTSLPESVAGSTPVVGNYMKSPEFQQAEQAGKEFLQAILRKDTGAAITPQETAEYGTVYLPRPGDSPAVLEQKKQSRQRALAAIEAGMPPQAILNQEKALRETTPAGQPSISTPTDGDGWRDMGNGVRVKRIK